MDFALSSRSDGRWVIVAIGGECDAANASELGARLLDALASEPSGIVLELSRLRFLDCAAASVLLAARRRATQRGGSLAIVAPTAGVTRLLELTGLASRLVAFADTDAALAALRAGHRSPRSEARRHQGDRFLARRGVREARTPGDCLPQPGTATGPSAAGWPRRYRAGLWRRALDPPGTRPPPAADASRAPEVRET